MINDEMRIKLLHATFINQNFIPGEEACNYEKYLLELVNNSLYFREKSNYEPFKSPTSEANSECDCISANYQMDFKLLASTTRLHASKELTGHIVELFDGVVAYCIPRKPKTQMKSTLLYAALRGIKSEQLNNYSIQKFNYGTIDYDIKTFVKILSIKKNIFFLFPYQFLFKTKYNFRYVVENIKIALEHDFKESILFRNRFCPSFDTYISCIYDDNLIVFECIKDGSLKLVDTIYLFKSATYCRLYDLVW